MSLAGRPTSNALDPDGSVQGTGAARRENSALRGGGIFMWLSQEEGPMFKPTNETEMQTGSDPIMGVLRTHMKGPVSWASLLSEDTS